MGDDLGLRLARVSGLAVRVLGDLGGRVSRLDGLGGDIPLRDAGGQLDVVVLLARAIPLRDPACGEGWRGKRGTVCAGRRRACHGEKAGGRGREVVSGLFGGM